MTKKKEWPLYEVFVRSRNGLSHKHVGSVHAADPDLMQDLVKAVEQDYEELAS